LPINSKIKRPITDPYEIPGYEEAVINKMNKLNNTDFKTIQEIPTLVFQVPTYLEKDGIPIGKLLNQAIYYVANNKIKEARKFIGKTNTKIIAKIERHEALLKIEEITEEADAVKIGRAHV
jgi:hypothetical protein